jgi:hypothetical protein
MEKLEGVQSAKVSLNEGRAVIDLEPENTINLAQIHERVRRNGFTPQGAAVTARAEVAARGDALRLEVVGTQESFDVAPTPQGATLTELKKHVGQIVVVEGLIPAPKDRAPAVIQVRAVKAESGRTP